MGDETSEFLAFAGKKRILLVCSDLLKAYRFEGSKAGPRLRRLSFYVIESRQTWAGAIALPAWTAHLSFFFHTKILTCNNHCCRLLFKFLELLKDLQINSVIGSLGIVFNVK